MWIHGWLEVVIGLGVMTGDGEDRRPDPPDPDPTRPSAALQAAVEAAEGSGRLPSRGRVVVAPDQEGVADPRVDSLDFRELPLVEALRILSEETGQNLVASAAASAQPITLHLREVSASAALDALAKTHALWTRRDLDSGIVRVHTIDEYRRERSSLGDDRTEVFTLLYPNAVEVATAIRDLYGDRVSLSLGRDDRGGTDELLDRFDRFDAVADRAQGLGLFPGNGGGGGSSLAGNDPGAAFLRRSDSLRNSGRGGVGARSGQAPELVDDLSAEEIEAAESGEPLRPAEASIQVTVIRKHNQIAVRTSDLTSLEQISELVRRLDVATPMVLLEVKILAIELGDGFQSFFDYQVNDGEVNAGFTTGDILGPLGEGFLPRGAVTQPGALLFQYVGEHLRTRMQLLENENRITVLASPLLLTANHEVSRLFVGEEVPLNRSFAGSQTVVGESTVVSPGSTSIEFRAIGTTLLITPDVHADRTVTLRIVQELSSVETGGATVLVPTDQGFQQQPIDTVRSRNLSGTVVAQDGTAVALGGLIEEEVVDDVERVPILGRIPGLGLLFRREVRSTSRRELVVVLRPYVLSTPAEGEAHSRRLMEELSLHPSAPDPRGTLGTFEGESLRDAEEQRRLGQLMDFHGFGGEGKR